jgi:hypothetical protein
MTSRIARLGATAAAAVFVMVGATPAFAQDTTTDTTAMPTQQVPPTTDVVTPPVTTPPADPTPVTVPAPATPATTTTTTTVLSVPAQTNPAGVMVPPQERGPMTVGNFNAAVSNQASHLRRLNQLGSIPGERITLINVANLSPSPATAGIENAISRAESRSASARAAASSHASIAAALSAAGVSADNVIAIAVRGHNENDVTVYHR